MTKPGFVKGEIAGALCALLSAMFLMTSCGGELADDRNVADDNKNTISTRSNHGIVPSLLVAHDDEDQDDEDEDELFPPPFLPPLPPAPVDQTDQFPIVTKPDYSDDDQTDQVPVVTKPYDPIDDDIFLPPLNPPVVVLPPGPPIVEPAPEMPDSQWDAIELMARTDPANPRNEKFLEAWRFQIFNIDDQARANGPSYFGESGPDGTAILALPSEVLQQPIVVAAHNDLLAQTCDVSTSLSNSDCAKSSFEIFVPSFCYDKAIWILGPLEDAIWAYYKKAATRFGEAWNPSQVDCGTWLANLQLLVLTDEIHDALGDGNGITHETLNAGLQNNQHLLTPTRPPICIAERRHNGGGMEKGERADGPFVIDDTNAAFGGETDYADSDAIGIGANGIVDDLCGLALTGNLTINNTAFIPSKSFYLDDQDFMGIMHSQEDVLENIDVSSFNVKLGNGLTIDHEKFNDACAVSNVIQFTNKFDDEQDLIAESGVTFTDLFGNGANTRVYLTSDGDGLVDDRDTWAIFYQNDGIAHEERVLAVELLGHRREDFRDALQMKFNPDTDDLFLGLRSDYELNEEDVDGERAYMAYTLHAWDGSSPEGRHAMRSNIVNCFQASDVWARQFFNSKDLEARKSYVDGKYVLESAITPFAAAEFAVRSQCFSNSRANQQWRTDDSGFWSINTDHGVHGNVIINPGWLAPNMDFEIFVQKFDEAVFKGPRTIRTTDASGQLMAELPTLVEGDRVLLKSQDNCCDDYDLVVPCVPEFTGFAGARGVPYVPVTLGPPPFAPGPVPVPVAPMPPSPVPVLPGYKH